MLYYQKCYDNDLVLSSKIKAGLLLRTFKTREAEPNLKMFNSFICSKLEYCSIIWNLDKKEEIYKMERIQRNFTSKKVGRRRLKSSTILISINDK